MEKSDIKIPLIKNKSNSLEEKQQKGKLINLMISNANEKPELKVTGDDYRNIGIHGEWRKPSEVDYEAADERKKSETTYFSYQEKAVKEFIYSFNRCGILSDQVGMGKTIEAGMIISELAYRKDLGSLLILVPNDIMVDKWRSELSSKFGFRNIYKDQKIQIGNSEPTIKKYNEFPKVFCIKNPDDFYTAITNAEKPEINKKIIESCNKYFDKIVTTKYLSTAKEKISKYLTNLNNNDKEFKVIILEEFYKDLITSLVEKISDDLGCLKEFNDSNYNLDIKNGNYYHYINGALDYKINNTVSAPEVMNIVFDKEAISNCIVDEFSFYKKNIGKKIIEDLEKEYAKASSNNEANRIKCVHKMKELATKVRNLYTFLIVSKYYSDKECLLSMVLNNTYESESSSFFQIRNKKNKLGYMIIDMLTDMSYHTLIVDEAHDYINVSHKIEMDPDVRREPFIEKVNDDTILNQKRIELESESIDFDIVDENDEFNIFPLFNDYYFVSKQCLFVKLKQLADRSYRKIFMTATPIKSEMADFYLLKMLADNSAIEYNDIRKWIDEEEILAISNIINNEIKNYQKKNVNFISKEEVVLRYLSSILKKNQSVDHKEEKYEDKVKKLIDNIINTCEIDKESLNEACFNKTRFEFQDTFTIDVANGETIDRKEISTVSDLVSSEQGVKIWKSMYSQIGIRATRHQTYKLDAERIALLDDLESKKRYQNLPIWSKRNSFTIYIHNRDVYFDMIVKEIIDERNKRRQEHPDYSDKIEYEPLELRMNRLEEKYSEIEKKYTQVTYDIDDDDDDEADEKNYSSKEIEKNRLNKEKEIKQLLKDDNAYKIYSYIDNQMTGERNVSEFYSVKIDNYDIFKLHLVMALMTKGIDFYNADFLLPASNEKTNNENGKNLVKISGKVLLFVSPEKRQFVLDSFKKELSGETKDDYLKHKYEHESLYEYNKRQTNEKDKWHVEDDVSKLQERDGNYIIVVDAKRFSEGIDLQQSDKLINFDIEFCPLKMEQRIGRIDRVKINAKNPKCQIFSFTPLNDMSGFVVDFMANDLHMFDCWKGDTTGIVSLPIGDKPNSASFEDAIKIIDDCYRSLYTFDSKEFIKNYSRLKDFLYTTKIKYKNGSLLANELTDFKLDELEFKFDYLKTSKEYVDQITMNTHSNSKTNGDTGKVIFGDVRDIVQEEEERIVDKDPIRNDLEALKEACKHYFDKNINEIKKKIELRDERNNEEKEKAGGIYSASGSSSFNIERFLNQLEEAKEKVEQSVLLKSLNNNFCIDKSALDESIKPIYDRYKYTVRTYLDELLKVFDVFCETVKEKSTAMSLFTSKLTIEEFKGITNANGK